MPRRRVELHTRDVAVQYAKTHGVRLTDAAIARMAARTGEVVLLQMETTCRDGGAEPPIAEMLDTFLDLDSGQFTGLPPDEIIHPVASLVGIDVPGWPTHGFERLVFAAGELARSTMVRQGHDEDVLRARLLTIYEVFDELLFSIQQEPARLGIDFPVMVVRRALERFGLNADRAREIDVLGAFDRPYEDDHSQDVRPESHMDERVRAFHMPAPPWDEDREPFVARQSRGHPTLAAILWKLAEMPVRFRYSDGERLKLLDFAFFVVERPATAQKWAQAAALLSDFGIQSIHRDRQAGRGDRFPDEALEPNEQDLTQATTILRRKLRTMCKEAGFEEDWRKNVLPRFMKPGQPLFPPLPEK